MPRPALLTRARRAGVALAAVASALWLTSCIDFAEQALTYRYDRDTDTLLIHQHYLGIFATEGDEPSDGELRELRTVLTGENTFFFANWILEWDLDTCRDAAARGADAAGGETTSETERTLARLLAEHVRISNGPFFLDAAGRLSGVQRVTVRRCTEVLAAHNALLREAALDSAKDDLAPEERAFTERLADPRAGLVLTATGAIEYRAPITRAQHDAAFAPREKDGLESLRSLRTFIEAVGGAVVLEDDTLIVRLPAPAADGTTTLRHAVASETYAPNMIAFVRDHWGIAAAFDLEADRAAFLRGGHSAGKP